MTERLAKVASLIKRTVGGYLQKELSVPTGVLVTITEVKVSADLGVADIGLSILPEGKSATVIKSIIKSSGLVQKSLDNELVMRHVPKLRFHLDTRAQEAERLDRLLKQ